MLCEDTKDAASNASALRELLIPILRSDSRLSSMRIAASDAARPGGAGHVAKWLAEAAG